MGCQGEVVSLAFSITSTETTEISTVDVGQQASVAEITIKVVLQHIPLPCFHWIDVVSVYYFSDDTFIVLARVAPHTHCQIVFVGIVPFENSLNVMVCSLEICVFHDSYHITVKIVPQTASADLFYSIASHLSI